MNIHSFIDVGAAVAGIIDATSFLSNIYKYFLEK